MTTVSGSEDSTPLPTILRWNELMGNRYMQALNPAMLDDGGMLIERRVKVPKKGLGKAAHLQEKEIVYVRYDRDYVIEKLRKEIVEPLAGLSYNDFQILLKQAREDK